MMIKRIFVGMTISVGDTVLPIQEFELETADGSKYSAFACDAARHSNIIDSAAVVIDGDVKALQSPNEVR
jgi:hypothetical protein